MLSNSAAVLARLMMGTITRVATEEAVAALTFDDGPHPDHTPRLLDILERYNARATFFMVGTNAQLYPEIVEQVALAGHAIGNHSWDHPSFPYIKGSERRAQIRDCQNALFPHGQKLFRPPYGDQSLASRLDALMLGYRVVTWDVIANDWLDHDADWIVNSLKNKIQPGSVILFHDAIYSAVDRRFEDREPMLQAVEILLQQLHNDFRFSTIPELLKNGKPDKQNWYKKSDIQFLNSLKVQNGVSRQYVDKKNCR